MQEVAMKAHFGWDDAAKAYLDVYRLALKNRRGE